MKQHTRIFLTAVFALSFITGVSEAAAVRPSKPTHLFYTPTAYLNGQYDLVLSLHEVSYTLPYNLQVHMSIVDNIGRNGLGIRYSLAENMQIGAGVAMSITTFGDGGHGIKQHDPNSRLGLFFCYGFSQTRSLTAAITPHTQVGEHISMGVDLGFMTTPNEVFSLIGEIGFSMDLTDEEPYLNLIGGLRIHPPKIPFLNFDIGIDFTESPLNRFAKNINPYIDIIFTMKTN
jgi:hypothetical protein